MACSRESTRSLQKTHLHTDTNFPFSRLETIVALQPPPLQPLPFVQRTAKVQLARGVETQPCIHFSALAAFGVVGVSVVAARNMMCEASGSCSAFISAS